MPKKAIASLSLLLVLRLVVSSAAVPCRGQPSYCVGTPLLSIWFDVGRVSVAGSQLGSSRGPGAAWEQAPIQRIEGALAPRIPLQLWSPDGPPGEDPRSWSEPLRSEVHAQLRSVDLSTLPSGSSIELHVVDPASGVSSQKTPVRTYTVVEATRLRDSLATSKISRDGGLVDLQGGQLRFRYHHDALTDARIDLCGGERGGERYCLRFANPSQNPAGTGDTLLLPFRPSSIFTAVWRRVYERGVEAFYLSINPTKQSLARRMRSAPTDRLDCAPPPHLRANEIVTEGDIAGNELGRVLLDADIAFKSADLGFDVQRRRPAAPLREPKIYPDPLDLERVPAGDRFCRYAWQSNEQTLAISNGEVVLRGPSIRAEAEPMELVRGELRPAPSAKWCGDAVALARRFNQALLRGKGEPASVKALAEVASIQSFAELARRSKMQVTTQFGDSLNAHPEQAGRAPACARGSTGFPRWTSGIQSKVRPATRLDRRERGEDPARVLTVYADDVTGLAGAAEQIVDAAKQKACSKGVEDCDSSILEQEYRRGQAALARKLSATTLPEIGSSAIAPGQRFSSGFESIQLPVRIHGGALLAASAARRSQARLASTLLFPQGVPLFRATGSGDLHFWTFQQEDGELSASGAGEHLVIRGGEVIARHAVRGKQRFVIEGPRVSALHEVRTAPRPDLFAGLEWSEVVVRGGAPVGRGEMQWQTKPTAGPAVLTRLPMSREEASRGSLLHPRLPVASKISLTAVARQLWLVEVSVQSDRHEEALARLLDQARQAQDAGRVSQVLDEAAQWGLRSLVEEGRERLAELRPDSVDVLRDTWGSPLVDFLAWSLVKDLLDELPRHRSRPAAMRRHLERIAELWQLLSPEAAVLTSSELSKGLAKAAEPPTELPSADEPQLSSLSPGSKALLEEAQEVHARRAAIAWALAMGGQP